MAYVKVWIHAVWGTKNRYPFLTKEIRAEVINHVRENARTKNIFISRINGYHDHMHCLFSLNADVPISKVMQLIKGESAAWINKNKITREKFEWADDYFAISVSESVVETVKNYIDGQEEHHRKKTFAEEYDQFMKAYQFPVQG
ncbi:MAG: IS200/IS605 family transposase [Bacteroidetes bacterium]|nr:IS200/IS605 family transposase [Bacteroidota bacterium]